VNEDIIIIKTAKITFPFGLHLFYTEQVKYCIAHSGNLKLTTCLYPIHGSSHCHPASVVVDSEEPGWIINNKILDLSIVAGVSVGSEDLIAKNIKQQTRA